MKAVSVFSEDSDCSRLPPLPSLQARDEAWDTGSCCLQLPSLYKATFLGSDSPSVASSVWMRMWGGGYQNHLEATGFVWARIH